MARTREEQMKEVQDAILAVNEKLAAVDARENSARKRLHEIQETVKNDFLTKFLPEYGLSSKCLTVGSFNASCYSSNEDWEMHVQWNGLEYFRAELSFRAATYATRFEVANIPELVASPDAILALDEVARLARLFSLKSFGTMLHGFLNQYTKQIRDIYESYDCYAERQSLMVELKRLTSLLRDLELDLRVGAFFYFDEQVEGRRGRKYTDTKIIYITRLTDKTMWYREVRKDMNGITPVLGYEYSKRINKALLRAGVTENLPEVK